MKTLCRSIAFCALTLVVSASVEAAPFTLSGGTAGAIPGGAKNDFIPTLFTGPQIGGYFGSQIQLNAPTSSTLLVEYFGAEAGYVNWFSLNGTRLFTHTGGLNVASSLGSPIGSYSTSYTGSGILPFRFVVNNGSKTVRNGWNPNDSGGSASGPNFFASCNPFTNTVGSGGTSCSSVYLFLDDGGAGPDDNHDDFLVRLSIVSVPEPASLLFIGSGLAALAVRRRKTVI